MARLSFKPDSSFFSKIAAGAVGTRAVCDDLAAHGHRMAELERGSTTIKLWKEVKRKRVRIPDLVCVQCGLRVESRAKKEAQLSVSHSPTDAERAWDYGFVDDDLIAFPVVIAREERDWHSERLEEWSYWHERNWVKWQVEGAVNFLPVRAFRSTAHKKQATKGATEGSESFLTWSATFSSRDGTVESVADGRISIRRTRDGHLYRWRIPADQIIVVAAGETVRVNQVIAATVRPSSATELQCPGNAPRGHIARLLRSKERTQRFTGVKLSRLLRDQDQLASIRALEQDAEEDIYIRLEAATYLTAIAGEPATPLFNPYLSSTDDQIRLEAVIALGEAGTDSAVATLSEIMRKTDNPYFMRAAAAWSLSQIGGEIAARELISAFSQMDLDLRDDALQGVIAIGSSAIPQLLDGLRETRSEIAAGCAEALRRQQGLLDAPAIEQLSGLLQNEPTIWAVWLIGHLPRATLAASVASLERERPDLHYAITVWWSFIESWIAPYWDFNPGASPPPR